MPCYAKHRRYSWGAVKNAQVDRLRWVMAEFHNEIRDQLVVAIRSAEWKSGSPPYYFRIHDSGEFFAPWYVDVWAGVANDLPEVRFFAPTKAWVLGQEMTSKLVALNSLPNVTVRPSAMGVDEQAPSIVGMAAGVKVRKEGYNCPATGQGNRCLMCRRCWDEPELVVSYHLKGKSRDGKEPTNHLDHHHARDV